MDMVKTRLATAILAAVLLFPAAPASVFAQAAPAVPAPAAPVQSNDPHVLAHAFLEKIGMASQMQAIMANMRSVMVAAFQKQGVAEAQAGEVADNYMMPEFSARMPELLLRFEDVMVKDFTVPELRAVLYGEQNDARRSAAAKAGGLPAHFQATGAEWGQAVGIDVFNKNRDALAKLGIDDKALAQ